MVVALFGGSFDPPHIGHEKIVKQIQKTLYVEKIFIVPTYLNPFKDDYFTDAPTRLQWIKKLFVCKEIEIIDFEVRQQRSVPSIETVEYLLNTYDISKLYLIIGADNFKSLEKWDRYDELKDLVEFVVATRIGAKLPEDLKKLSINVNISSSKLRDDLDLSYIPQTIREDVKEYYNKEKND